MDRGHAVGAGPRHALALVPFRPLGLAEGRPGARQSRDRQRGAVATGAARGRVLEEEPDLLRLGPGGREVAVAVRALHHAATLQQAGPAVSIGSSIIDTNPYIWGRLLRR